MKKLIRTFGWSTPPAVALLVVIMLMTAVNATAKVGDTFTKGKLKFTVLTEEGDSGTVNMNIQVRAAYKRYYNYKLNIPENCNKSNIRYKIVSISEIVRVHDNIRPPYNNFPNIIGHISIPNSVTTIGDGAFYGCSGLTGNLVIPNSVTTIGNYAFNKCTGLTTLTIPSNINNIDGNAFQGCSNLKTLYINSKKIENGAFYDCTALSDIYFGESVTTIGDSTFQNCPKLTKVALPNSVVNITGYNSFAAYSSHIVLPSNLTVMKGYFQKAPDITIPYSACNDNLGGIGNSPIYFMGTDLSVGNFKSSNGSKHTYVKPSVYAQFKNDATYKNLNITDSIPVTFPEGQEYITLCRDFDVDLRHANDHLPLNVKSLLPNLAETTRDYHRWRYNEMILETYQMAKSRKDTKTMEKAATSYAKYNRIDIEDETAVPYNMIVVQPFVPTMDPTVLGIKPIKNIDERIRKLTAELSDSHPDTQQIEYESADLDLDKIFKENPIDTPPEP